LYIIQEYDHNDGGVFYFVDVTNAINAIILKILREWKYCKNTGERSLSPYTEWNESFAWWKRSLDPKKNYGFSFSRFLLIRQTKFIWPKEIQRRENVLYSTFSRTFHFSTCYGKSRKRSGRCRWSRAIYGGL